MGPITARLCPLLAGKGCRDFEDAHGVMFELDLDRPQHRESCAAIANLRASTSRFVWLSRPNKRNATPRNFAASKY